MGRGPKLEARKAESGGWGSWGGGSEPPSHQLGDPGRCELPQRGKFEICSYRLWTARRESLPKVVEMDVERLQ